MAGRNRPRCTAHRTDGQPCKASAIPGGTVCERHGGSAPQVRIKAGHTVRKERHLEALLELADQDPGSERWYQANDRVIAAERDLAQYEADLDLIALLRVELRDPSGSPAIVAALLGAAEDRLGGRPWNSPVCR